MSFSEPARFSRRRALQMIGGSALATPLYGQGVVGANERVRLGVIGCGSRSGALTDQFSRVAGVEFTAFADPDTEHSARVENSLAKKGARMRNPAKFRDYRKLLESKEVDAVIIASPNHWHTLHAIHAMAAGKDVYVEKPVSHSLWEGLQLAAAEKKYGRIIAAGFQNRSDPGPRDGFQFVREGHIGKVKSIRVCCFRNRQGIGKRSTPLKPPTSCDYDMWLGPAEDLPIMRDRFHYDWHWIWNTGNGETGNQAPHETDLANWFTGDCPLPTKLRGIGGRFGWDDAGNTPNMHTAWCELGGVPCTIELNDLRISPDRKSEGNRNGTRVGVIVTCEGGELRGGRGGTAAYAEDGKTRTHKFPGNGGAGHMQNFIDAVRSRRSEDIASKISVAVRSSAISHLANLSHRSGGPVAGGIIDQAIGDNETVRQIIREQNEQLAKWGINMPNYSLGRPITLDPATTTVTTAGIDPKLIKRDYRKGYEVPELA